tara:strand:- start:725 stop:1825 length:1101 start_codon:yes stop_codon:yes gene_type:complete
MTDTDSDNKSKAISCSLTGFILWVIVYANTSKDNFNLLEKGDYFNLAQFNTFGNLAVFVCFVITSFFAAVSVVSSKQCWESVTAVVGAISIIALIGVVITQIVLLGKIMHNDIEHTFIGYKAFWTEGVMNFTLAETVIPTINNTRRLTAISYHDSFLQPNSTKSNLRGGLNTITTNPQHGYHSQMISYYNNHTMPTNTFAKLNVLYLVNNPLETDPVYHMEMARYYRKVPKCVFLQNCNSNAFNSIYNTLEYNYNQYWNKYHQDMVFFYTKGIFPSHILSQVKVCINELQGVIQYSNNSPKISKERRLLTVSDKTTKSENIITHHWPYIMADVLTRIITGALFLICIILATMLACGGGAYGVGKCC